MLFTRGGSFPARNYFYEMAERASGAIASVGANIGAAGKQCGFGANWVLTPAKSGRVGVTLLGRAQSNVIGGTCNININSGTGAAPANGAAYTGNAVITDASLFQYAVVAGGSLNFSAYAEIPALAVGVQRWFDLVIYGTAPATSVAVVNSMILIEEIRL